MNELQIFNNAEFGQVRTIVKMVIYGLSEKILR